VISDMPASSPAGQLLDGLQPHCTFRVGTRSVRSGRGSCGWSWHDGPAPWLKVPQPPSGQRHPRMTPIAGLSRHQADLVSIAAPDRYGGLLHTNRRARACRPTIAPRPMSDAGRSRAAAIADLAGPIRDRCEHRWSRRCRRRSGRAIGYRSIQSVPAGRRPVCSLHRDHAAMLPTGLGCFAIGDTVSLSSTTESRRRPRSPYGSTSSSDCLRSRLRRCR